MGQTRKPYYKLTVGKKPYTSADMKFGCGRIRVEVSDARPDASAILTSLVGTRWSDVCRKVLAFFAESMVSPEDYLKGRGVTLTEPPDMPLRDEVARMDARATALKKEST